MTSRIIRILLIGLAGWVLCAPLSLSAQDSEMEDQVWKVDITGNATFANFVIKNQIATEAPNTWQKLTFWDNKGHELDEIKIKKDVIRIRNYYRRRGFVNVSVNYKITNTGNKEWKKKVEFIVREQYPIKIRSVDFKIDANGINPDSITSDPDFQYAMQNHAYRKGNRYETVREPEVIGRFGDVFKNMGFAYADVSIEAKVDTSALTADLTILGNLGPRTYIDSVDVEGDLSVSKDYVLRESALKKGEQYSTDKLQEAQQELFNHHLFRFATISIPDQPEDSTLILQMRIRERKKRSIELLAGLGTEEKIRGEVSWTHRNVAGTGHKFSATVHASFIEQSLRLDYLFPYIYNTKSSIIISPFGQHLLENNYELLRAGLTNSFIYRYNRNLTGSASYEITKNQELSRRFQSDLPDTTLQYDLSSFQFTGYYNETLGRQQEGWFIQPYLEFSGVFGLATYKFQKISVDIRRFERISRSTLLALRVQGGALYNVPTDSLPNNIRFYLGGTNSVRGWYRQQLGPKRARTDSAGFKEYIPLGGRAMFGFNLELRQQLDFFIDGFGIAAFLDGGQIWQTFRRVNSRPIQFGMGGGLRYQSPIGPIRVDVGYKLNPTDKDLNIYRGENFGSAWDRIGIHFSIGQAF